MIFFKSIASINERTSHWLTSNILWSTVTVQTSRLLDISKYRVTGIWRYTISPSLSQELIKYGQSYRWDCMCKPSSRVITGMAQQNKGRKCQAYIGQNFTAFHQQWGYAHMTSLYSWMGQKTIHNQSTTTIWYSNLNYVQ